MDGVFDENGVFDGTMTISRAGQGPESASGGSASARRRAGTLRDGSGSSECLRSRSAAIRNTAEKAGFGTIGVREARKLLDSISGVAIYREGFRVRPYGDSENDWLTLDAKRVQNPTMKIGRNQIAGIIMVDDEESSHLIERSSREGLEENGSFRRLQSLIGSLLRK